MKIVNILDAESSGKSLRVSFSFINKKENIKTTTFLFIRTKKGSWRTTFNRYYLKKLKECSVLKTYREQVWENNSMKDASSDIRRIKLTQLVQEKKGYQTTLEDIRAMEEQVLNHPHVRLHTLF